VATTMQKEETRKKHKPEEHEGMPQQKTTFIRTLMCALMYKQLQKTKTCGCTEIASICTSIWLALANLYRMQPYYFDFTAQKARIIRTTDGMKN
jgi:hypothetical protein